MHCWIELNRAALAQNLQLFYDLLGKERVAPVLKSNAYGHGMREIYEGISKLSPTYLCTNYVSEAVELRRLGYVGRLIMVGPFLPTEMAEAHKHKIELFLGSEDGLTAWLAASETPPIHLEFDTGMSRQGLSPTRAEEIAKKVTSRKDLIAGLCMHFANVEDVTEHSYATQQLQKFAAVKSAFAAQGIEPLCHTASSASALLLDNSRFDICRVGISLYGFWPSQATRISYLQVAKKPVELQPVLTWKTKITSITAVDAGQYVGYGCTYRARHAMRVGVLPVGYYEGYPRIASGSNAYVLIRGERCPILGRICMNMMMVDVTDLPDVKTGEEVVLIGSQGKDHIAAADVAGWSQTIHYEIVTRLHPHIPKKLL